MLMTVFSSLFMITIVFIVVGSALPVKIEKRRFILSSVILVIIFAIFLYMYPVQTSSPLLPGVSILFALLIPMFVFRFFSKLEIIYLAALAAGVIFAIGSSILWIAKFDATIPFYTQALDLTTNFILLIVCIFLRKRGLLYRIYHGISLLQKLIKVLLLSTVWISALLGLLVSFFSTVYSDMSGFALIRVTIAGFIILIGVMCPLLILNSLSKAHYKSVSDAMEAQVLAQVNHYESMAKINEDLRHFKHDYLNLRLGLENRLKREDIAGALDYLNSDEMKRGEISDIYETGNVLLNAMLGEKQILAEAVNATIEFEGLLPGNMLSDTDVCIIFGNALDNAIEACAGFSGTENKTITIKSTLSQGFLLLRIENPVLVDVNIINNSIATTKENKLLHGFGLQSIRKTLRKYSGGMELKCSDGLFCLKIYLDFNQFSQID